MKIESASLDKVNSAGGDNLVQRMTQLGRSAQSNDKLAEVCNEFEAIFLDQLFKGMRKTAKLGTEKSLLHGGMGEDIFKDLLYTEYSKMSAQSNSIGIAKMVYDQITQQGRGK